jgi:hypothetical protein
MEHREGSEEGRIEGGARVQLDRLRETLKVTRDVLHDVWVQGHWCASRSVCV